MTEKITFLGLASGLGGRTTTAAAGPFLIRDKMPFRANWQEIISPPKESAVPVKKEMIAELNTELAERVYNALKEGSFPIVIGGDHSCGVGTWSGTAAAFKERGEEIALLWMDAHMDCHTFQTSESGNIHGMPLAALLGSGAKEFTRLFGDYTKLKPENVFLIGVRSFEKAEKQFIEEQKIRCYYSTEVLERGLKVILQEIVENLAKRGLSYGISLDIDFFDPIYMKATGSPEPEGFSVEEFIGSYNALEAYPPAVFEFVEFNPICDPSDLSLENSYRVLEQVVEVASSSLSPI